MTVLDVTDVSGGYTRARVLHGINLRVDHDEIIGVLGANGAGKTSILRALSGVLPSTTGQVVLDGRSIARLSPWARVAAGVAHVPEGRHVFSALTVRENLDVGGLVGRRRFHRDDVFGLFPRLAERQRQYAGRLSGGEQQMLAVGRALMTAPRVLLVDEMSAGLSPLLVHQLVNGLVQIRGQGTAIILVEQNPHFIANAVDRVYLVGHGRIVGEGTFDELGGSAGIADVYLGMK